MNLKSRQVKYGSYAAIYVIVILAVLVVANWLASKNNKSVDVTANKRFTLSDQTKKVVGNLNKDVNIYYFDHSEGFETGRDMLDRYRNLSSKIHVNYVDPEKKPDVARAEGARSLGDVVIDSGTKRETAKALTEEELTGALIRSVKNVSRTACFVTGSGEHSTTDTARDGYSAFKDALEKSSIKTQTVSLIEKTEIPKDCNVVIVGGPKNDYLQPAIDALKNFVRGGGALILSFDAALSSADQGSLGNTPSLAALAQSWGITANPNIVIDLSAYSQVFGRTTPAGVAYESHPITRVMSGIATAFPLTRTLDVKSPAEKLVSTGDESYALTNPKPPIREEDLEKGAKGPFVVAAAATVGSGATAGHVVVYGSSLWLANGYLGVPQLGNRDLALNTMNWLTADTELISIRPKDPEDRRLHITGRGLALLPWASLVLMPLLVIVAGISVWWKRR